VRGRIVCLGDIMMDVLAALPGPLAPRSDTPAPISLKQGGSAANTSAWLAHCGIDSVFIGKVGADSIGRDAVAELTAQGVSVHIAVDDAAATGTCIVLVAPDGERTMIPSAGANDTLSVADLPELLLCEIDRLHVSAYSLFRAGSRDAALALMRTASSARARISVDVASSDPIRQTGPERFLSWIPSPALLIANVDEARALTGAQTPEEAGAKLAARFAAVVVKCGSRGALVCVGNEFQQVSGAASDAVDSTGAGDAFAAGLLAGLHHGNALITAVAQGNELGARAVRRLGARPRSQPY
jgi:ribokinase